MEKREFYTEHFTYFQNDTAQIKFSNFFDISRESKDTKACVKVLAL